MKFRLTILVIWSMLLFIGCVCTVARGEVSVVVVSSLQKVLQDEVNIIGATEAEVFCAKGEYESFQIIVLNPTGGDLPQIDVIASEWKYMGSRPDGIPVLRMFREHYVEVKRSSSNLNRPKGMYPDALIPFVDPYTGRHIEDAKYLAKGQNVKAGNSQGYWIDIFVSDKVRSGIYSNEITVLSNGQKIAAIPLRLTVWNFELPKKHKLKTYFGDVRDIKSYHNVTWGSPKRKIIIKRYMLMLRDHGISPIFPVHPKINKETGEVIFTSQYIGKLRAFTDEMHPSVMEVIVPYSIRKDPARRARYLRLWQDFINRNPWIPEPFIYFITDVSTEKGHLAIIDSGTAINTYAPSIKLLITDDTWYRESDYPDIEDMVDIWVPIWGRVTPAYLERHGQSGAEIWPFGALAYEEIPSWLIDFSLLDYRIPAWSSWSLNLKGIFYWQTMAWSKKSVKIDPWVDCETYYYKDKKKVFNGEGSLIYPGKAAGIDGPVASMRLKVFRDSVEDYDYFSILSELAGRDQTEEIVTKVASSLRVYSKLPQDYTEARKMVAKKILDSKRP